MADLIFFQSTILTQFVYPFFLIFFLLFAILDRTKILGEEKKQLNALIAFIIAFIFVTAVFPKAIVSHLILFLTLAIVIVFIVLLIWGFIMGGESLKIFENAPKGLKWVLGILIVIAVAIAVLWAAGVDTGGLLGTLFNSSWSESFWTNLLFVVLIAIALTVILRTKSSH